MKTFSKASLLLVFVLVLGTFVFSSVKAEEDVIKAPKIDILKTAIFDGENKITYEIKWKVSANGGGLSNLTISDVLPDGTDLVKKSVNPAPPIATLPVDSIWDPNNNESREIVWDLGGKEPGEGGMVRFIVETHDSFCEFNNTAHAIGTYGDGQTVHTKDSAPTVENKTNPDCIKVPPECDDGKDNDEDGFVDYPNDPGCSENHDESESPNPEPLPECSDGIDNDQDEYTDVNDPGCHTDGNPNNTLSYDPNDDDETDPSVTPECSDGIDNDGDQNIDFPNDKGCESAVDESESSENPLPQCSDGIDNDGDGLSDTSDPGCHNDLDVNNGGSYDPNDNDETNTPTVCSDGLDNDGDGKVDSMDPGCWNNPENPEDGYNPSDNDEEDQSGSNPSDDDNGGSSGGSSGSRRRTDSPATTLGQVLGAETSCGIYVDKYLRKGYNNNTEAVKKVQTFLNTFMKTNLRVDGNFGEDTEIALKSFQLLRKDKILTPWGINEPTGIFYITTQTEVNNIMCPALGLPIPANLINFTPSAIN